MKDKFVEIEDFSSKEITDMFNYICTTVLKQSPIEIKTVMLGKKANANTKVELSHLLLLIEKNDLKFKFRVNYLEAPAEKSSFEKAIDETADKAIAETAQGGVKTDVIHDAMQDQQKQVQSGGRVFTEVPGGNPESEDQPPAGSGPATFDPSAIPYFRP